MLRAARGVLERARHRSNARCLRIHLPKRHHHLIDEVLRQRTPIDESRPVPDAARRRGEVQHVKYAAHRARRWRVEGAIRVDGAIRTRTL